MKNISQNKLQLKPEAFHGLAGEIIQLIEPHTESDPAGLLIQFLVMFGNAIGRNAYFQVEADRHYANLNCALVGLTSNGRKGTSFSNIKRLFEHAESEWTASCIKSGLSSGEGLIWNVRDPLSDQEDDIGVKDKRLLLAETEFASVLKVLGREGNTLSAVLRNAWDSGSLSTLTKNQPAKSTGAHVSVIAHVTKAELDRYLADTEAANGFGNRFLWVRVGRSKCLPRGGRLDVGYLQDAKLLLSESIRFSRSVKEVKRSNAADLAWDRAYMQLTEGRQGLLGAITARAAPQVMRLALIFALIGKSTVIELDHLEAALAVWEYCDQSCRSIFGDTLGDPLSDEILQTLRGAPNGLTRTEISNHFGRNKQAAQISRALGGLYDLGLVECILERPSGEGRPIERWFVINRNELNEINQSSPSPTLAVKDISSISFNS